MTSDNTVRAEKARDASEPSLSLWRQTTFSQERLSED